MSYDEYKRFALMIVQIMKDFEGRGEDNVLQSDIIETMIQQIEIDTQERQTSVEKSIETSKKI